MRSAVAAFMLATFIVGTAGARDRDPAPIDRSDEILSVLAEQNAELREQNARLKELVRLHEQALRELKDQTRLLDRLARNQR